MIAQKGQWTTDSHSVVIGYWVLGIGQQVVSGQWLVVGGH